MRTRSAVLIGTVAAVAGALAGCPSSCPLETPQVSNVPANGCTVNAGQPITYEVRLCPSCNLSSATCEPQMSGNSIFLDVKMEACSGGSSCPVPPACDANATPCSFTVATAGSYNVIIPDGQGGTYTRTLDVVPAGAATSCALATAGI